jgi:polyisoprenyl-phosphate glycosyltransferase
MNTDIRVSSLIGNRGPGAVRPFISVLMPLYCEERTIGKVLADVRKTLATLDIDYEVVLVDDGSKDHTWEIVSEEAFLFPTIRAVQLSRNFGKESALCAGLEMVRGDAVVVMDGDGQHPPSLLSEMVRLWLISGADIVEGVKVTRGRETLFDKAGAHLFYSILNRLSGHDLRGASDYKLLSRKALNAWLQMEERNLFFRGMTAWLGFTRVQVPFAVEPRNGGHSGWSFVTRLRLALTGISAFSSLPLQFVTFTGLFFLMFSAAFGLYTLVLQFMGKSVTGFATVILLLLIIGSLLMISLGIMGQYLAHIYEEVKRRPRYVIADSTEVAVAQPTTFKVMSATAK